MNPNVPFERDLEQWLQDEAPVSAPAGFHASVMDRARTLRQRPGWATSLPVRRFGRGRGMTLLAAAALLGGGALAAGSGVLRLPSIVPPVASPSVVAVATASPDTSSPGPSELAAPSASPIPVAGPGGVWIQTGSMVTPRSDFSAVRLLDGRVLVAGGHTGGEGVQVDLTSAELYDPATGTWSATGNMLKPHEGFPATLLRDGRVLVGDIYEQTADDRITTGAEVYDPGSGTWSSAGKLFTTEGWLADTTATLLSDGKVLVAGQNGAQLYDANSGTWSRTAEMITPRHHHTATLLPDGRVLVTGGTDGHDGMVYSAELYEPDTGSWTATANTRDGGRCRSGCPRGGGMATLLQDGTVLSVRRSSSDYGSVFAETYDPATETWTPTGDMARLNADSSATRLLDGTVLVTQGNDGPGAAELYDPKIRSWTSVATMPRIHYGSPATLLLDGSVLVAGGSECQPGSGCWALGTADLYVPAGLSPPPAVLALVIPSPAPRPIPTAIPTPYPPAAGPVPADARSWTVTVVNNSSEPGTLFLAEEGDNGIGQLCGSVTPNVVPAGVTQKVTFLLPPKRVTDCWLMLDPVPGLGGSMFQTSDAPMTGKILFQEGEGGRPQVGWLGQ
jgi:hypothetical protein